LAASRTTPPPRIQLLPPNTRLPTVPVPLIVPPPDRNCAVSAASGARVAGFTPFVRSFPFAAFAMSLLRAPVHCKEKRGGWIAIVLVTGADVVVPSLMTHVIVRVGWLVASVGSAAPESNATDRRTRW